MADQNIVDRSLRQWIIDFPLLREVVESKEVFWRNPNYGEGRGVINLTSSDIEDASERLQRFAPYIRAAFPKTLKMNGIIESPLVEIPKMQMMMEENYKLNISGKLLLKCDHQIPISGSIKARGGIYEVLKHAEDLALENRLIKKGDTYEKLNTPESKQFFSQFSLAVGSTGNLGLSIGIIGARLGFNVSVHMSADAKEWKKDLLRSKGVNVIEHQSDYSIAVEKGRKEALKDPQCYFIDDENSKDLFLGYAVAAKRLKKQLDEMNIVVDEKSPLFVYLPCV